VRSAPAFAPVLPASDAAECQIGRANAESAMQPTEMAQSVAARRLNHPRPMARFAKWLNPVVFAGLVLAQAASFVSGLGGGPGRLHHGQI
jgi:hypothetical protein